MATFEQLISLLVLSVLYFTTLFIIRKILPIVYPEAKTLQQQKIRHETTREHETFKRRVSHLDSAYHSQSPMLQSEFRGFFTLGVVAMVYFVTSINLKNFLKRGTLIGVESFRDLFARYEFFFFWMILILGSFVVVPLQKLYVKYNPPLLIQYLLHSLILIALSAPTLVFIVVPDWPIVPKASFTAELFVLLMKVHSYLANNRVILREGRESKADDQKPSMSHISFSNYLDFLLVPTLVYEKEYPRTESIRYGYVFEKLASSVGIVACLHIICDQYISPTLQISPQLTPIEAVVELIVPFFFCYMLIFYLVFDCMCNGFAELTKFADREFYKDWWNSTTLDEFARNWNKPVHMWLWRHIYVESIMSFKVGRETASFITFLFSSIFHEAFLVVCFQMIRPYLFFSQMSQIPLIIFGRELKGTRLGNFFFWFSIQLGIPLLSVLYCREYYALREMI